MFPSLESLFVEFLSQYVEQVGLQHSDWACLTCGVLTRCWFSPSRQTLCHSLLVVPVRSQSFDVLQGAISKHLVNILHIVLLHKKHRDSLVKIWFAIIRERESVQESTLNNFMASHLW